MSSVLSYYSLLTDNYLPRFISFLAIIFKFLLRNPFLVFNALMFLNMLYEIIKSNPQKNDTEKIEKLKKKIMTMLKRILLINMFFIIIEIIKNKVEKKCYPLRYNRILDILKCSSESLYLYLKNNYEAIPVVYDYFESTLKELFEIVATVMVTIIFTLTVKNMWFNAEKLGQNLYG
jgi:hypothetical protein